MGIAAPSHPRYGRASALRSAAIVVGVSIAVLMPLTGLAAQTPIDDPADDTGRRVQLVIYALLAVAVLLALLTIWYWRHTDPRRRQVASSVNTAGSGARELTPIEQVIVTPNPAVVATNGSVPEASAAPAAGPAAASPEANGSDALEDVADLSDDGADEWLRLTGPQDSRG